MFRTCELVLVNKIDLLPHLDFDLDTFLLQPRRTCIPACERMLVSARTGEGVDAWREWLRGRGAAGAPRERGARRERRRRRMRSTRCSTGAPRRTRAFFAEQAERLARLCHRMAERFARGGRLVALGGSPAARSDARHVAVEFVHPVIVGKRALPAHRPGRARAATGRAGRAARPSRTTS